MLSDDLLAPRSGVACALAIGDVLIFVGSDESEAESWGARLGTSMEKRRVLRSTSKDATGSLNDAFMGIDSVRGVSLALRTFELGLQMSGLAILVAGGCATRRQVNALLGHCAWLVLFVPFSSYISSAHKVCS